MSNISTDSININPDRQRKELTNIESLAESIANVGLINPIVVDENNTLIAGERRLSACKQLGWTHVPVTVFSDLSVSDQHLIELEENVKREELPWRDHCAAIATYHALRKEADPEWTQVNTASALGTSTTKLSIRLAVQDAIEEGHELVLAADKYSVARGIVVRAAQRMGADAKQSVDNLIDTVSPTEKAAEEFSPSAVVGDEPEVDRLVVGTQVESLGFAFQHADFNEWKPKGLEQPFNFIHCDFPYGIDADKHHGGASDSLGGYADSKDVYFELIDTLGNRMTDGTIAESAHLMFWFSMDYYKETLDLLINMGWTVNPFPLVWHKNDNTGVLPDPKRGPRRIYETAFICSRGDRFIAQAVGNVMAHPVVPKATRVHMSEKPVDMLLHFFRMFVDSSTHMLDPTMGSGNSIRAALESGASTGIGLERDEDFLARALKKHKSMFEG